MAGTPPIAATRSTARSAHPIGDATGDVGGRGPPKGEPQDRPGCRGRRAAPGATDIDGQIRRQTDHGNQRQRRRQRELAKGVCPDEPGVEQTRSAPGHPSPQQAPASTATTANMAESIEKFDTAANRAPKVTTNNPTATQSTRSGAGSTGPGSVLQPATSATAEMGTISRKIHRQEPNWSRAAAMAGPAKARTPTRSNWRRTLFRRDGSDRPGPRRRLRPR